MDPPRITRHPEKKLLVTGADAVFTVEATGDELQFKWQKDGECIDEHEPWFHCSQTDTTSTLCIKHVSKDNTGHYQCVVKNRVEMIGKVSNEAELLVCELSFDVFRMFTCHLQNIFCTILALENFTCRLLLKPGMGPNDGGTYCPIPPTKNTEPHVFKSSQDWAQLFCVRCLSYCIIAPQTGSRLSLYK